jgi:hypothetical protein
MISLRIAEILSLPKNWVLKSKIRKLQKGLGPQIVIFAEGPLLQQILKV